MVLGLMASEEASARLERPGHHQMAQAVPDLLVDGPRIPVIELDHTVVSLPETVLHEIIHLVYTPPEGKFLIISDVFLKQPAVPGQNPPNFQ